MVRCNAPKSEIKLIGEALQRGQLTGGEQFRREVSERLGIRRSNKGHKKRENNEAILHITATTDDFNCCLC